MASKFDPEDIKGLDTGLDTVVNPESRKIYTPPSKQKIHWYTVGFLMLNRTIGSGIFVTPVSVLQYTRSPGLALIFWVLGGLMTLCVALVWLEFGLSTPRKRVAGDVVQCVPRSGGEKNYVSEPRFLINLTV